MKASKYFTKSNGFSYVSDTFLEKFGDMKIEESKYILESRTLGKNMMDKEIFQIFKPDSVSLGDMANTLKTLDKNGLYILYVKDLEDKVWAVGVHWGDGGWAVCAFFVERPSEWLAGSQVLSRRFLDTLTPRPSEPLTCPHCGKEIKIKLEK